MSVTKLFVPLGQLPRVEFDAPILVLRLDYKSNVDPNIYHNKIWKAFGKVLMLASTCVFPNSHFTFDT